MPGWAIAMIVVGAVVALTLVVLAVVLYRDRVVTQQKKEAVSSYNAVQDS